MIVSTATIVYIHGINTDIDDVTQNSKLYRSLLHPF